MLDHGSSSTVITTKYNTVIIWMLQYIKLHYISKLFIASVIQTFHLPEYPSAQRGLDKCGSTVQVYSPSWLAQTLTSAENVITELLRYFCCENQNCLKKVSILFSLSFFSPLTLSHWNYLCFQELCDVEISPKEGHIGPREKVPINLSITWKHEVSSLPHSLTPSLPCLSFTLCGLCL